MIVQNVLSLPSPPGASITWHKEAGINR